MWDIICMIVFGAVIGMLARLFMRGNQNISALMTVVLGVLGAVAGYYIAAGLGDADTKGIDWIRDIVSVLCAMLFISVYVGIRARAGRAPIAR